MQGTLGSHPVLGTSHMHTPITQGNKGESQVLQNLQGLRPGVMKRKLNPAEETQKSTESGLLKQSKTEGAVPQHRPQ